MTRTQNSPNALLQHTFENAVRVNNAAQVEQLIKDAPDFQTPQLSLQWAAWCGDAAEVTKWLAHPHAYPSAQSFQALRWAAKNGHANIVALLIPAIEPSRLPVKWLAQPHADPSAQSSQALLWAAKNGHANIVALLIPTIEPSRCPVALTQALRWAARNGHAAIVSLLFPVSDPRAVWAQLLANGLMKALGTLADPAPLDWIRESLAAIPPRHADHDVFQRMRARVSAHDLQGTLSEATAPLALIAPRSRM